jgi:hypothetical protein
MELYTTPKGLQIILPQEWSVDNLLLLGEGLRITQVGSPRSTVFNYCVLLKQGSTLAIYQKRLFPKKCSVRFEITLEDNSSANTNEVKKALKWGYLQFAVLIIDCKVESKGTTNHYTIPLPNDSFLTQGQYLSFDCEKQLW